MKIKRITLKKIQFKFHNKSLKFINKLNNNTDLKKLIDSKQIISFDIFDTIIVRKVLNPVDIFKIVEKIYIERYDQLDFNFTEIRRKAEPEATKIAADKNGTQCIDFHQIYAHMQLTHNIDPEIINRLQALEIEFELKFCVKNEYMFSFYQYCLDTGKKIIITSDMYLPEDVITKILHKNGYTQFDQLFLSCVIGKSKSNGSLYTHILDNLQCKASELLHIGDYYYADIINAMKKGIKPFYYKKSSEYAFNNTSFKKLIALYEPILPIEESIYFATIINKFYTHRNTDNKIHAYNFGYIYCGIIYFGFIRWLTDELIEQNIDKAFFLARDGHIMEKVYQLLNQEKDHPPSVYMYGSRRSINIPTIEKVIDDFSINILCNFLPGLNVANYLNRVHIDAKKHLKEIIEVGFPDHNYEIKTIIDKDKLVQLFILLSHEVCKNTAIEREVLINYLEQIDFLNTKKIAIIDIGWRGTMQNSLDKLMKLLNISPEINGYYLGTFSKAQEFIDKGFNMSGYGCNLSLPKNNYSVMSSCVEMFEFIFSAPHGSVINFSKIKNKIEPVCEDYDSSSDKSKIISDFQKGAIDFISDYLATEKDYREMKIDPQSALNPIARLLSAPSYKESVYFGNITHSEYIGKKNYERYFAKLNEPWWVLLNPLKLRKIYYSSIWKTGLKKRYLGF